MIQPRLHSKLGRVPTSQDKTHNCPLHRPSWCQAPEESAGGSNPHPEPCPPCPHLPVVTRPRRPSAAPASYTGNTDTRYSVLEVRLCSSVDELGPSTTTWNGSLVEWAVGYSAGKHAQLGKAGVSPHSLCSLSLAPGAEQLLATKQPSQASTSLHAPPCSLGLLGAPAGLGSLAWPPPLLISHADFITQGLMPVVTFQGAGRGSSLTSLGTPPLEGRQMTRYLRGGCRAGVQDRWTLEEVTWLRTRLVGVERGSRAGAADAGLTERGKVHGPRPRQAAGISSSACLPWQLLPERTGVPQEGAADPLGTMGIGE